MMADSPQPHADPRGTQPPSGGGSLPPPTPWEADEVATAYARWDNTILWVFGYPFAIEELRLSAGPQGPVLDLGCGPGHVAGHLAAKHGRRVIGADSSPGMIKYAREHNAHPLVEYTQMDGAGLGFLADDSVACAICCFVFITIPEIGTIRTLVREAHRALRPGGRFVMLDVHPESVGIRFAAFQVGEEGRTYGDGEPKRSELFDPGGGAVELRDYHWSEPAIRQVLADAGFREVTSRQPVLADAERVADAELLRHHRWDAERTHPPFLILAGTKESRLGTQTET
jgi:SAM-dependent methyltransferase